MLSPIGLKLASYYPLPNQPTKSYGAANYIYSITTQDRADQGTFKLDHEFAPWLRASASYLHYGSQEPSDQTSVWCRSPAIRFHDSCQFDSEPPVYDELGPYASTRETNGEVQPFGDVDCTRVVSSARYAMPCPAATSTVRTIWWDGRSAASSRMNLSTW